MKLKTISAACALAATTMFGASAQAQVSGDVIRIGFITDLSGVYADIDGPAGAEAIRMAIAEYSPVARSTTGVPIRSGPVVWSPLMLISPVIACRMAS